MSHDNPIETLERLPLRPDETWQGGLVRLPGWVKDERGKPCRPYVGLWVSVQDDLVSQPELCSDEGEVHTAALDSLIAFAKDAQFGGYRPGRVEVKEEALAKFLAGALAGTGISESIFIPSRSSW